MWERLAWVLGAPGSSFLKLLGLLLKVLRAALGSYRVALWSLAGILFEGLIDAELPNTPPDHAMQKRKTGFVVFAKTYVWKLLDLAGVPNRIDCRLPGHQD